MIRGAMHTTPLDVAAVISAALCDTCRDQLPRLAGSGDYAPGVASGARYARPELCPECRGLEERVRERLRTGVHPDTLAALAARILASRSGSGKAKRRGGRTKAEVSAHMRRLAAMRKHPGRKLRPN